MASLPADTETESPAPPVSGDDATHPSGFDSDAPPPDLPPSVGRLGRYLLLGEIGAGGMGVVHRGYDPHLLREVALKTVRLSVSPKEETRLVREARAMAQLSHRNVVAIYDVELVTDERGDRRVLLVMELAEGVTLKEWLEHEQRSPSAIADVFARAGRGLAAAHRAGLLHRDFKPANVLVTGGVDGSLPPSRVRVADFGLARDDRAPRSSEVEAVARREQDSADADASTLTRTGVAMGTPRYMAPEQHVAGALGPAADQYAFCVALWEALAGAPPFDAETALLFALKRRGPPSVPRSIPRRLARVLRRGLAPEPDRRFPSMDDLCAALVPSTGARRAVVGSFAVAALGTGGVMAFGLPGGLDQRCADPEARLAGVWDDDARRGGAEAFEHTGLSYADELWDKLSHKLDAYADAWTDGYRDACEATHKRGEASVHTLDLRMSCLGQARAELGVVSEALAHADGNVLSETDRLVAGLPSLERCADVDALQAGTPPPSPEVRDEVEALQARVAEARANRELGRIDEAEALLDGIPARAKITGYDPLIARLDFELGRLALNRAHLVDSEAAFKRVLERAQKLGDSQLAGAAALELLRASSDDTYDPGRGEAYSRIARAIVSGMPGQERLEARRLAYDASRRAAVGDDPGALRLFEEALANLAKVEGDHVRIEMSIRNGYAMLLGRNARLEEAETEERRVLDALLATLGERHPAVGSAHANLGQTLTRLGEHEEAEEHARLALEIKRDAYGDMHPAVARAYRNLAEILGDKDALAEAIEISRQVVETQIRANGRNHPSVAEARSSLGIILRKAGQYEAAVSELEQALAIQLEAFGPDTVEVAKSRGNLANTWFIWHRYEDAEREGRLAVRLFTELQGPDHAHTRTARANLASYLRSAGKYEEAEALLREAIDGNARAMGPKSMAVGDLRLNLANLLLATGRAREAVVEHEAAVRITVAAYGADHPATAAARYSYALSLNEVGRRADAEKELQIALEIRQRAFPSGHVVIADTARMLGQILFDAGRTDEAEPLLRQAYEITRPTETPSDERGGAAFAYARLLWRRYPARRDEARTLARGALDDLTTARNNGQDVDDQPVRTWVAAHP